MELPVHAQIGFIPFGRYIYLATYRSIAEMKKPNPELSHQRAIELFGDYFERVGTDAWRVR